MTRFWLLALCLVASCGVQAQTDKQSSIVTETVTVQMIPATSVAPPAKTTVQCIHWYVKGNWTVEKVLADWNRNGVNLLKVYQLGDECVNHIIVEEVADMTEEWGRTQFSPGTATAVLLAASTPARLRQSVLCHELGHTLGLGHENGTTCMNIQKEVPIPSQADLETLQKSLWDWDSASRSAGVS